MPGALTSETGIGIGCRRGSIWRWR